MPSGMRSGRSRVTDVIPNQAAFLATLRSSEGSGLLADPWRATFQGENPDGTKKAMHIIQDLSNHPTVTGEWLGESLAFLGPSYAHSISTAAGAYMIIKRTWLEYQALLKLTNFGRQAQDDVALQIVKDKGALDLVNAGDTEGACALLHEVWASLPGSQAQQPVRSLAFINHAFILNGGQLA